MVPLERPLAGCCESSYAGDTRSGGNPHRKAAFNSSPGVIGAEQGEKSTTGSARALVLELYPLSSSYKPIKPLHGDPNCPCWLKATAVKSVHEVSDKNNRGVDGFKMGGCVMSQAQQQIRTYTYSYKPT